jgi:hypothetical protein
MKKIVLVLVAVLLCFVTIGGYAYAQTTHNLMGGNKILGFDYFFDNNQAEWYDPVPGEIPGYDPDYDPPAYISGGYRDQMLPNFILINPNCDITITINQVSVLVNNGTLLDEWKLSDDPATWTEGVTLGDVPPHGEWMFASGKSIMGNYDLPGGAILTLEVFYSAKARKYLPLQGKVFQAHTYFVYEPTEQQYWPEGLPLPAEPVIQRQDTNSSPMVNY